VEQQTGAVVRHAVGSCRYEGPEAAAALARLYAAVRLFVNFVQPCCKLAGKTGAGANVKKTYHPPATPYQRLLADVRPTEAVRRRVTATCRTLDPVRLLQTIRAAQEDLVRMADRPGTGARRLLRRRWTSFCGDYARPGRLVRSIRTSQPKPKASRGRRRPDPLVTVTPRLREWFEAEPWRTAREWFERLRQEHPGVFPDGQLRRLQRRLKAWRHAMAHKLVLGAGHANEAPEVASVPTDAPVSLTVLGRCPQPPGIFEAR
jgi:hypothetical protein